MTLQIDPQRRYAGKPLVKLLDAYVLWAIGALGPEEESLLQRMIPRLQQTWNRTEGSWQAVLAAQMGFRDTMPETIREIWAKNQAIAAKSGATLNPVNFAHMFVDQNFNRSDG